MRTGRGKWITGRGWIETFWKPPRFPTRHDLDEIAPGSPVLLTRADGHAAIEIGLGWCEIQNAGSRADDIKIIRKCFDEAKVKLRLSTRFLGRAKCQVFYALAGTRLRLGIQILVVILALGGELYSVIATRLGIFEDFSFIIADHDLFIVMIQNVARIDRHFAAAAGRVDDELRDAITGSVPAQTFDDLDPLRDRSA